MVREKWKIFVSGISGFIESTVSEINHNAVIKDLTGRAELSGSYILMIVLSCLVALLGLLTNSIPAVIGAMLISPLMGPIFSAALAFSIGDLRLARQALKIILYSIMLTVLVAAFFTLLSPLKLPTQEILSRTRPNIYDLLIAAIAGTAGAYAICTKANYLLITTGVAVATAVIPPLSVVGYGIGTGQFGIALGGFLLFFTNLVAIVISSDIVFHIFRFRTSMVDATSYPVRRRVQILGVVLALISVPLVYTLVVDIKKAKLTSQIEAVMKRDLDRKDYSRMTACSLHLGQTGLIVSASVNTVSYFDTSMVAKIEGDLTKALNRPVALDLEQVIVRPGRVALMVPSLLPPTSVTSSSQPQTLASLGQKAIARLQVACDEIRPYFQPFPITQSDIRFSEQKTPATVMITLARDYPITDDERRWIQLALEKSLGEPLELELETVPFLPTMKIGEDGKPDEESLKALQVLMPFTRFGPSARIVITAPKTIRSARRKNIESLAAFRDYLIKDLGVPPGDIVSGPDQGADFRARVERNPISRALMQ